MNAYDIELTVNVTIEFAEVFRCAEGGLEFEYEILNLPTAEEIKELIHNQQYDVLCDYAWDEYGDRN